MSALGAGAVRIIRRSHKKKHVSRSGRRVEEAYYILPRTPCMDTADLISIHTHAPRQACAPIIDFAVAGHGEREAKERGRGGEK